MFLAVSTVYHDVEVGDATPVKQHPYRMNPVKLEHLHEKVEHVLKNDIIEPSDSEWSSPCILASKPDQVAVSVVALI